MLDNNQFGGHSDFAQFLEKFKQTDASSSDVSSEETLSSSDGAPLAKTFQYERSFEKLEQKIQELEDRFDASEEQNERILAELAQTRQAVEEQQNKDAFVQHLSRTIANLKASVESLARAQQDNSFAFRDVDVQRGFDSFPQPTAHTDIYHYEPDNYRAVREQRLRREQEEKERIISSLHYKASQLKAVNSALDREIRQVQQEKMEALKKSAEQAKEILLLRDQLTQAEERFKSFDFEGRIISVRQEYEQRVSSLETQLKEISETCMRQVEEIENLRAQNIKLQQTAAEKEQVLLLLEEKERELQALKEQMAVLKAQSQQQSGAQKGLFAEQIRTLETQRGELAVQFQAAQQELQTVRSEKEVLEKNFQELVKKINSNDAVLEQLKQKIDVLVQHNVQLAQRNRQLEQDKQTLTQENQRLAKQNSLPSQPQTPAKVQPILRQKTKHPTVPLIPRQPVQPETPSQVMQSLPTFSEGKITEPVQKTSSDTPISVTRQTQSHVQTAEDLPKIKTAATAASAEDTALDRDDFLKKTDTFLGRIKWSIFREDR